MLDLSRIVLGTANFHQCQWDSHGGRMVDGVTAEAIIHRASTAGLAGFDTADGYGFGAAEATLGRNHADFKKLGNMAITTKVGFNFYNRKYAGGKYAGQHFWSVSPDAVVPFDTGRELTSDYLHFATEQSHRRLGRRNFNVLLHCPDPTEVKVAARHVLQSLGELNYILQVGVSVKMPEEVFYALQTDCAGLVQIPFAGMASRAMRLAVDCARRSGATTMLNQPFGGGFWLNVAASQLRHHWPGLSEWRARGIAARALLRYVQDEDLCDLVVVGVSSDDQLRQLLTEDDDDVAASSRARGIVRSNQLLSACLS